MIKYTYQLWAKDFLNNSVTVPVKVGPGIALVPGDSHVILQLDEDYINKLMEKKMDVLEDKMIDVINHREE